MSVTENAASHRVVPEIADVPTERLEAEICTLAGQIAVLECRWLLLVGEFDRRRGFDGWECRSTAHWLTWKCGMASRTAQEKVRIARRLEELPIITAAFAKGELSYSKVRALTKVAGPATEQDLVEIARHATGAQIERLVSGCRTADRLEAERNADEPDPESTVRWWHDEDGSIVVLARLSPESGDIVVKALEAAIGQERAAAVQAVTEKRSAEHSAEDDPTEERPSGDCSAERTDLSPPTSAEAEGCPDPATCPVRSRAAVAADALATIADAYLAHPERLRTGNDRYAALVILDDDTLRGADPDGSCTLGDGTTIEPDTARRLACDCARQPIIRKPDGSLLDAGHQTRTINRATRRALVVRDGGCVFPGCGRTHWVDGHHIVHWANHGPTRLDNLVLLCRHHHRAVHEGGYTITGNPQQAPVEFFRPDGSPVDPRCEHPTTTTADQAERYLRSLAPDLEPGTITGKYVGDPLLLGYTVAGIKWAEEMHRRRQREAN